MSDKEAPLRHIAISGDLGSGKSAVTAAVAKALGLKTVSTGALQRQIARELSMSTLEANLLAERDRAIDTRVDAMSRGVARGADAPLVFDSRMAWYVVPLAFKVRLVVDPDVAVDRIVGRGATDAESYVHREDAEGQVRRRVDSEVRRFVARYGVDVTDPRNFDLVIDTSDIGVQTVSSIIVDAYRHGPRSHLLVSPRRVLPSTGLVVIADSSAIEVCYRRPFFVVVRGVSYLIEKLRSGEGIVTAMLGACEDEIRVDASLMQEWQDRFHVDYSSHTRWLKFSSVGIQR